VNLPGTNNIDMATISDNGSAFLMTMSNGVVNGTLGVGSGNRYRLGGAAIGSNGSTLTVNANLTGENNGLIIGALSGGDGAIQAGGNLLQNGQTSVVVLNGANSYGAGTWINGSGGITTTLSQVTLGGNHALGTGIVYFNGGAVNADGGGLGLLVTRQIDNDAVMLGDVGSAASTSFGRAIFECRRGATGARRAPSTWSTRAVCSASRATSSPGPTATTSSKPVPATWNWRA
jgi:hypothetical protein